MFTEDEIVKILGSILVLVYAFERFNTPPNNRTMTTAARYYTAASTYMLIYLSAYFLFITFPGLQNVVLSLLVEKGFNKAIPATVVGAILISSILPKMPAFSFLDGKLKKFFQNLAAIPMQALRLSHEIYEAPFSVPAEFRQKVRDHMIGLGFDEADLVFEQEDSAKFLWLKNAALLIEIKDWKDDANFSEFFMGRNEQFKGLDDRYHRLVPMAQNCFNLVREMKSRDAQNSMEHSVRKFCSNFKEQADDLLKEICQFASQGILKCRYTHGSRCRKMHNMGFYYRDSAHVSSLSIHQVLLLWGLLVTLLSVNFINLSPEQNLSQEQSQGETILLKSTMIVSIYLAAAWFAVLLKDKLPTFRRRPGQLPPVGFYLISGLVSVVVGTLISLFFKTMIFSKGDLGAYAAFDTAWKDFYDLKYPWMFMSFATAILISVLSDYPPPDRVPAKTWRFVEAVIMAGFLGIAGKFVHWWLQDICPSCKDIPALAVVFVVSAVVGLVLGLMVPSWYRNAKQKEHIVPERADVAVLRGTD